MTARNDHTGDKIQSKLATENYRNHYDNIQWNTRKTDEVQAHEKYTDNDCSTPDAVSSDSGC